MGIAHSLGNCTLQPSAGQSHALTPVTRRTRHPRACVRVRALLTETADGRRQLPLFPLHYFRFPASQSASNRGNSTPPPITSRLERRESPTVTIRGCSRRRPRRFSLPPLHNLNSRFVSIAASGSVAATQRSQWGQQSLETSTYVYVMFLDPMSIRPRTVAGSQKPCHTASSLLTRWMLGLLQRFDSADLQCTSMRPI